MRPAKLGKASRNKSVSRADAKVPEAASEQFMAVQAQHHSGPLPAPQTLAGYESVLPGSAERILVMAEKNQDARIKLDMAQLEADIQHREQMAEMQKRVHTGAFLSDYLGQILGFIIALCCIAAAAYAGLVLGNWPVTAVFLGLPVVGMVQAVRGMKPKKKED